MSATLGPAEEEKRWEEERQRQITQYNTEVPQPVEDPNAPVGFSPTTVDYSDQTNRDNPTFKPGYYANEEERAMFNPPEVGPEVDLNKQEQPVDNEMIKDIPYYEGVRTKVYDDPVKGKAIPTIGVGFNLKNKSARSDLASVGLDLDDVLAGQELSNEQVHDLFQISVGRAEEDARKAVSQFDDMPHEVQKILVNMSFQLGLPALQQFRPTLRELEDGNYKEAASRLEKTLWYKQSGRRSKDIVKDLRELQA